MITLEEKCQNTAVAKKVRIKRGCDNCENAVICKYKNEFTDYTEGLESMDLPEVVFMDVSCKYYKGEVCVKRMDMQGREYNPSNPSIMIRKGHKGDHIRESISGGRIMDHNVSYLDDVMKLDNSWTIGTTGDSPIVITDSGTTCTLVAANWNTVDTIVTDNSENLEDLEIVINCDNCGAPVCSYVDYSGKQLHRFDTCKCPYCGTIQPVLRRRKDR